MVIFEPMYSVIDIETTGTNNKSGKIIEIAIIMKAHIETSSSTGLKKSLCTAS